MEDENRTYIYHYCISDGKSTSAGIYRPSSKIEGMAGYYNLLQAVTDKDAEFNSDTSVITSLSYLGEEE